MRQAHRGASEAAETEVQERRKMKKSKKPIDSPFEPIPDDMRCVCHDPQCTFTDFPGRPSAKTPTEILMHQLEHIVMQYIKTKDQ